MDLTMAESELKKRLLYPYKWGKKQNNADDRKTNFIYNANTFEELLTYINTANPLFDYALNRWYNYISAQAIEQIFCQNDNIVPALNPRDRLIDFSIGSITFDHKTTVFPQGMDKDVQYMKIHKDEVIKWLYDNQSQQGRKHHKNRMFLLLYDNAGSHWKLKADITWLKSIIELYLNNYKESNLVKLDFGDGTIYSDIIWAIK